MWENDCSKEAMDYRLIALRFVRKIWIILLATVVGIVLVGALYYYMRTGARGGRFYQTESIFYLDFATDENGTEYDYYNYYTWGEVIHTDFFMDYVYEKMGGQLSIEELTSYITGSVDSDVRYLVVRCTTHDPELSKQLAAAMEEIVPGFAEGKKEFAGIELAQAGDIAKDSSKIRMGNAYLLGAMLGCGVSLIWVLLAIICDTAIYIPGTMERRYKIPCLGSKCMEEYESNCRKLLEGAEKIAVVAVDSDIASMELLGVSAENVVECGNPIFNSGELNKIKKCDKVVIFANAGVKNHEGIVRLLEFFNKQEIEVTATALAGADEKLIKAYYRSK